MNLDRSDIHIGRLISEDAEYVMIEVAKNDHVEFHLDDDANQNRFFSLIFVRKESDGAQHIYKPFATPRSEDDDG